MQVEVERVLGITMALAQELAVTRERLDTLEGVVAAVEIETFAPTPGYAAARGL